MPSDSSENWTSDAVQGKVSNLYCFVYSPENSKKRKQKIGFLAFLQRFFDNTLLHSIGHAPNFFQIKGIMNIRNLGKSHVYTNCGSQVIIFQIVFVVKQ